MSALKPRFAVIGDPIAHSVSPRLFAHLAGYLDFPFDYSAVRVTASELPSFLARVRQGAFQGLSVTLPHKEVLLQLAETASETARATGAANTLRVPAPGRLEADNTDGTGLVRALAQQGVSLGGARVLVLGAGGAARAAAQASQAAGARALFISNRTPPRAEVVAAQFGGVAVPLTAAALQPVLAETEVLLHATSAGLCAPSETALPPGCVLHRGLTVLDMVYQPLETALLRNARASGARTVDGLWMLVYQALEQLRLWTGVEAPPSLAGRLHLALAPVLPPEAAP
jgi:shikimate dehydrogenase